MLHYAAVFLVIALIAAVFGFGGIAAGAAGITKTLFVVFLIGAFVTFSLKGRGRISAVKPLISTNKQVRPMHRLLMPFVGTSAIALCGCNNAQSPNAVAGEVAKTEQK